MKFIPAQLAYVLEDREAKQNLGALLRFVGGLFASIGVFSVIFHSIMVYEGQSHSWVTGVYWTLTVMSTLGFGDITFQSDWCGVPQHGGRYHGGVSVGWWECVGE